MNLTEMLAGLPTADLTELLRMDLELRLRRELTQAGLEAQREKRALLALQAQPSAQVPYPTASFIMPIGAATLSFLAGSLDEIEAILAPRDVLWLLLSEPPFTPAVYLSPTSPVKGFLGGVPVAQYSSPDIWACGTRNREPTWAHIELLR